MKEIEPLYIVTIAMVIIVVMFIIQVILASNTIAKLKSYLHSRDKHYLERISGMENLIKKEFLEVIKSIKNL